MTLTSVATKLAKGLAGLFTVVALFYSVENFRGARAWQAERERLLASGEELSWARLVPEEGRQATSASPLTPLVEWGDPNFLKIEGFGRNFGSSVGSNDRISVKQWRALLEPPQSPVESETACDAGRAFLKSAGSIEPTIERLAQAAESGPVASWDVRLDGPPASAQVPHLLSMRRLTNLLRIRIASHLACHETSLAIREMRIVTRLVDSLRGLPFLITYLMRIALEDALLDNIETGLADDNLGGLSTHDIDSLLVDDWFVGARDGFRAERNWMIYYAEVPSDELPGGFPDAGAVGLRLMPRGWRLRQAIHASRFTENMERLLRGPSRIDPVAVDALAREDKPEEPLTPYNIIARTVQRSSGRVARAAATQQMRQLLVRAGLALREHRLRTGTYPASLTELESAAAVPRDIVNGEPLRYRRTDGGFVLYSAGWDLKDDGGRRVPGLRFSQQPDWVLSVDSMEARIR